MQRHNSPHAVHIWTKTHRAPSSRKSARCSVTPVKICCTWLHPSSDAWSSGSTIRVNCSCAMLHVLTYVNEFVWHYFLRIATFLVIVGWCDSHAYSILYMDSHGDSTTLSISCNRLWKMRHNFISNWLHIWAALNWCHASVCLYK